jgi:hypothetical protein
MSESQLSNIPLLGALCVAAGLVSQEALEECLELQQTINRGTLIGQIMVLQGYLSQYDLARMVAQQQSFRRTICAAIENTLAEVPATTAAASASPVLALRPPALDPRP